MSQGNEQVLCKCGSDTFKIRYEYFGDHITTPGTTAMVTYCAKCNLKKWVTTLPKICDW